MCDWLRRGCHHKRNAIRPEKVVLALAVTVMCSSRGRVCDSFTFPVVRGSERTVYFSR